jgi:hypothetical protein
LYKKFVRKNVDEVDTGVQIFKTNIVKTPFGTILLPHPQCDIIFFKLVRKCLSKLNLTLKEDILLSKIFKSDALEVNKLIWHFVEPHRVLLFERTLKFDLWPHG